MRIIKSLIFFPIRVFLEFLLWILVNTPTRFGVLIRGLIYKRLFKQMGKSCYIEAGVTILGFGRITLGENVRIAKNSYIYANDNGVLEIGNNFAMNTNSQLGAAGGKIIIGNNCAIGPNCVLRAANHAFGRTDIPIVKQGHEYGEIHIGDDVWIASNCVITANTKIGKSCVIAAGSVVTKDVEEFSVVGGIPAKIIKKRV